jgi:glycosyltransferase involved in cell wall biosynthesis
MKKLAIILSHPIQYYAPWFRSLHADPEIQLRVFYLWNFGVTASVDRDFGQTIEWDVPMLDGYDYEWVANTSDQPGTHHIRGLQNPSLIAQVQAYQPDAVLLMNYNYASIYHFLWHWRACPVLFRGDSHRLVPDRGLKAWLRQQWISQVYHRFDRILYVGKANYDYFRHHNVGTEKLVLAPHAIENQRFTSQIDTAAVAAQHWKQTLGIPAAHRVVLFAGKLIPKKRPIDLLEALITAKIPNTSLLFVGSGRLETELRSRAKGYNNIFFAPFQNQSLMPRTYAIGDLFVLPSYGNGETWGLAVNEAMCLAKPVIVSNHVGCARDLVQPGQNGLIFPAGDIVALRACLQQAFQSPKLLTAWGQNSRRIIEHHSYSQLTTGLKQALVSLNDKLYGNASGAQTRSAITIAKTKDIPFLG